MIGRSGLILLLALIFAAGCGGGSAQPGGGGGGTGTTTATVEDGTTDTRGNGEETGFLDRHDVNQGDVAALLSFAAPSAFCVPGETDGPDITVGGTMEGSEVALGNVLVCLSGFTPMSTADAEVTFPDGSTKQVPVSIAQNGQGRLPPEGLSGGGNGRYEVTAADESDPSKTASASFFQAAFTVSPEAAPAGTTFAIALAGFPPSATVPIFLYETTPCPVGPPQGCWAFRAYLPKLTTDGAGNAGFELVTQPDDKATSYCLMLGTFSRITPCQAQFRVEAP